MNKIFASLKESQKDCYEDRCRLRIGRLLAANKMLTGTLGKLGNTYRLYLKITDIERAGIEQDYRDKCELCTVDVLPDLACYATYKLLGLEPPVEHPGRSVAPPGAELVVVRFESEPEGAVVMVDDDVVCQSTPCSKALAVGQAKVSMAKEGYYMNEKPVRIEKDLAPVKFNLTPRLGYIKVLASDYAENDVLADVYIDGIRKGKTFENIQIIIGTHTVEVQTESGTVWRKSVEVKEGQVERLKASLDIGGLRVETTPQGCRVRVDGKSYRSGESIQLRPGEHEVAVEKDGYHAERSNVSIVAGEEVVKHIKLYPASWARGFAMAIDAGGASFIFNSQVNSDIALEDRGNDMSISLLKLLMGYRHFRHFAGIGVGIGETFYSKQVGVGDYPYIYPVFRYYYYISMGSFEPFLYGAIAYYPNLALNNRIVKFEPKYWKIAEQKSDFALRTSVGMGFHKSYDQLNLGSWGLIVKLDAVSFSSSPMVYGATEKKTASVNGVILAGGILYELSFRTF